MNNSLDYGPGPRSPWSRRTRAAVAVAVMATAALLAACGSSPSSSGSGASSSAAGAARPPSALAFAQCVHSHGVPSFPDPDPGANGTVLRGPIQSIAQNLGVGVSQLQGAINACKALDPKVYTGPGGQPLTAQEQQDYLKAAACMRSHGVPNFPDPSFSGGHVNFSIPSSIDTSSPQVAQTIKTCQKLIPAGLPYSGTN